jgi:glycosyltransferase involved in cell wall biosynthesis
MNNPKITLIISTNPNEKHFLQECLDSIHAQTFTDFEIIVLSESISKNEAVKKAQGQWICLINGSDKIAPDCLQKLFEIAQQNVFDLIYCQAELINKKNSLIILPFASKVEMSKQNCLPNLVLYRKSDFEKYGGYDENLDFGFEDWDFYLNFIQDKKDFYCLPNHLLLQRSISKMQTTRKQKKIFKNYLYKKHINLYKEIAQISFPLYYKLANLFLNICKNILPLKRYFYVKKKLRRLSPKIIYQVIAKPKLIMTLYTKNEADLIEKNLIFHKANGIDGFIVTDSSTDETREIYKKYKDKGWVLEIIDENIPRISQVDWVNSMICLARKKYKADWIINCDADEFWYSKTGNLKDELSILKLNKIFVWLNNMICEDNDSFVKNTKRIIKTFPKSVQENLIKQGKLARYSQFSPIVSKVIHQTKDYLMIHSGNHDADMLSNFDKVFSNDIVCCHYSCVSAKHFIDKIKKGYGNREFEIERESMLGTKNNVGVHTKYFIEGAKEGTLDLDEQYYLSIGKYCQEEIKKYGLVVEDKTVKDFFVKAQGVFPFNG